MDTCTMCLAGLHASCLMISCACSQRSHSTESVLSLTPEQGGNDNSSGSEAEDVRGSLTSGRQTGNSRRYKRDATLKDQQSTGRKRAARLYPLDSEGLCEWQGLSNVGGGKHPIVGCVSGSQQARHHGPDKSVSNNEPGNVHRICHRCHNRWHAANNEDYDWNQTLVNPHRPVGMSIQEKAWAMIDEEIYKSKKQKKIKD